MLELQCLEEIYLEESKRGLEATKTVSLDQFVKGGNSKQSLSNLIQEVINGNRDNIPIGMDLGFNNADDSYFKVSINLNTLGLDTAYNIPAEFQRYMKKVALSLSALIEPDQDLETLGVSEGDDKRFVTLTHGEKDSGMYYPNYDDKRFLPFEAMNPTNTTLSFNLTCIRLEILRLKKQY